MEIYFKHANHGALLPFYQNFDKLKYGAMTYWLRCWIPNPVVPCSKPLGGSKVDSVIHPSMVDKMSTRNFWELSGKN